LRGGADRAGGRPSFDRRGAASDDREWAPRAPRPRHDEPELPESVTAKDLNRAARAELKTLSKENADEVARHLAMAAQLIDDDPALAHRHALAAERRAGRVAVVRETLAITAYRMGEYALALRELRTYRRISGKDDQIALMVDSERGVGRADRALELGRSVDRAALPVDVQVSLAIAMSGARLDRGETEAALAELEIPQLTRSRAFSYSPELFDAYATVLEDLGRPSDAAEWHTLAGRAREALGQVDEDVVLVEEEEFAVEQADTAEAGDAETDTAGAEADAAEPVAVEVETVELETAEVDAVEADGAAGETAEADAPDTDQAEAETAEAKGTRDDEDADAD
jgi:hypothetical protein